jgi:hypothetical protein
MNKQTQGIRETYNRVGIQKTYTEAVDKVGLWRSEKIMFDKQERLLEEYEIKR